MPVPAAGLTDVSTRDPQPLVLRWRRQHAPQQLTVAGLDDRLIPQRQTSASDPLGQGVAHLLQLLETGNARFGEVSRDPGVEVKTWKSLDGETRQLVLEAPDLAAQLGAREALIASHAKCCERVSVEQIRHRPGPSVNHQAPLFLSLVLRDGEQRGDAAT